MQYKAYCRWYPDESAICRLVTDKVFNSEDDFYKWARANRHLPLYGDSEDMHHGVDWLLQDNHALLVLIPCSTL